MRKRKWAMLCGVLILLLLFIAWQLPAGWALTLARSENPGLEWSSSSGSIWRGTAENVYWQGLALGRVEWRMVGLDDWSGLQTRWQVRGGSTQYRLDGQLIMDGSELRRLENFQASLPAAWIDLSHAVPFVYLTGKLDLDLDALELRNGLPAGGTGSIHWQEAGLGGLVNEPLGDIEFDIGTATQSPGAGLAFGFRTVRDHEIRVRGEGNLLGDEYAIGLALRVADHRADLHELLQPLGETGPNGEIQLQWHGKLYP